MHIERSELVEILRCRGNDHTAERAEQSLPQHVDLHRDRESLRQCGIDPNVLAFILSGQDRNTDVPEPPSQPAVGDDDAGDGSASVDGVPRTFRTRQEPPEVGSRTVSGTTSNVSQMSVQSLPSSDEHADQVTARSSPAEANARFRVTPEPAIRCPRCQFAFGSPDPMLDHLNADHLKPGRMTHVSSDGDGVTHGSAGALAPPSAALLADLESAYRRSSKAHDPGRLVIGVILAYLLIVCLVVILV